jgi:hypothetical protein
MVYYLKSKEVNRSSEVISEEAVEFMLAALLNVSEGFSTGCACTGQCSGAAKPASKTATTLCS